MRRRVQAGMNQGSLLAPSRRGLALLVLSILVCVDGSTGASEGQLPSKMSDLPRAGELERGFVAATWTFLPGSGESRRTVKTTPAASWDLRRAVLLSVNARHLGRAHRSVRLRWYVLSHAGGLYHAARSEPISSAGTVTKVELKLDPEASALTPVGHQRPWDALAAAEVVELALQAEVSGDDTQLVEIELSAPTMPLRVDNAAAKAPVARVLDLALEAPPLHSAAAATLVFRIDPLPADPFSATGDGDVRVTVQSAAQKIKALAYLDQDHVFLPEGTATRAMAVGEPRFRAHLPELPANGDVLITCGACTWSVPVTAIPRALPAAPRAASELRPRWSPPLEVESGRVYEPGAEKIWAGAPEAWAFAPATDLGWRLAQRPALTRVWRPVLFWNANWGAFSGKRRPDFVLARALDEALAATRKAAQPLLLLDGETFARQGVFTWQSHPLNSAQGGVLAGPGELFSTTEGVEFLRRSARYAVARWGHSRAVSSFVLDVTLNSPGAPDFHARLAEAAREWSVLGESKPLWSLHPLACEPVTSVEVLDTRRFDETWRPGLPRPATVRAVLHGSGDAAIHALEVRSAEKNASVCAEKTYNSPVADWRTRPPDDFGDADALLFEVWLPPDAPADLRAGVHLRDRDRLWFQALLPGLLRPGDWTTCVLELTERNAHGLTAVKHAKPWTPYSRSRITEIGLHIHTTHPEKAVVARFARVRAVRFDRAKAEPPQKVELLEAVQQTAPVGGLWECHLKINRTYANPFDVQEVDLVALVKRPSGQTLRVPAFFNQPCVRREETPGGAEIVEPVAEERWTVRVRVTEEGPHEVAFELREKGCFEVATKKWAPDQRFSAAGVPFQPLIHNKDDWVYSYENAAPEGRRFVERVRFKPGAVVARLDLGRTFTASPPQRTWRGFVRTDAGGRYFRFDEGSFFYPIGPCLRSPSDDRLPYLDERKWSAERIAAIGQRGTFQYDDYFTAFEKAGINWARVWMCSWWCGLQWRRDWPGYGGLMRYNLSNAWRMDHLLAEAERRGVYLNLCLTNHGQYAHVIDTEWQHNPFNLKLGGPLRSPAEFFTRATPQAQHANMLRYVAARWGHSPAVMTWALFSELEFTDEYRSSLRYPHLGQPDAPAPHLEAWHAEMAEYLKAVDPWQHPVSTHFSHPLRGAGVFQLPQVEIAMSNAYSAFEELAGGKMDAAAALSEYWNGSAFGHGVFKGMQVFKKPVLVEEQGRHWMGVERIHGELKSNNTREQLDADLHAGLWGSMVQPLAGATGYWWWLHVHFDDRYQEYLALAQFMKGEDFRSAANERKLEPEMLEVTPARGEVLARALRSETRAYLWVYHHQTPLKTRGIPEQREQRVTLTGLRAGPYTVEFWDTRTGQPTGTANATVTAEGVLTLQLPPIQRDLAVKVKRKQP